MNCSLSTLKNHTNGFSFGEFIPLYAYLNDTCLPSSDIFFHGTRMLTEETCERITGISDSIWSGWTPYPIEDIWTRIVTWKLPLFQLVGQFPRAPLGVEVEAITIFHALGDPIDTITSLLLTLELCQARVKAAQDVCSEAGISPDAAEYSRTWKGLAIFMVSYDDVGKGEEVPVFCAKYLKERESPDHFGTHIRPIYDHHSDNLASDRQTKTLPVALAEAFFIGGWLIALIKAAASDPNPTNWPNVEVHSVAFSGLYLWVTSAVVIASVIGSSQTESAIPRVLHGFENSRDATRTGDGAHKPQIAYHKENDWCSKGQLRAIRGGLNCWRPRKWQQCGDVKVSMRKMVVLVGTATVPVGVSYLTSVILSYYVPPRGPSCRHIPETLMGFIWLFAFIVECLFERWIKQDKWLFWCVFTKDLLCAMGNVAIVMVTQWGIMNRCDCWSMWGLTGLHLPHIPEVAPSLMGYTRHIAPWIVTMSILFQFLFCGAVAWNYRDAARVFMQRDDGRSHI